MKITFTKGFSIPVAPFNNAPMSITAEGDEGESFEDLNTKINKIIDSNYENLFQEAVERFEKIQSKDSAYKLKSSEPNSIIKANNLKEINLDSSEMVAPKKKLPEDLPF